MNKSKNTPVFEYTNTNPRSSIRSADCVVRSISIALDKTWMEVYDTLCQIGRKKNRMPNEVEVFAQYLKDEGWEICRQPRRENRKKYTGEEFVQEIANGRTCIMLMANHLTCCKDNKLRDTWNCCNYTVGRFWVKKS